MKSSDFATLGRTHLAAIKHFPVVEFADYERSLATMQETLQLLQQAYLGTSHRAGRLGHRRQGWGAGGAPTSYAASTGPSIRAASRCTPSPPPTAA
jgi:hypothetical protein